MSKKFKILGYQTNIEWYDVRIKFKQLLRKITYSVLFQWLISSIFYLYIKLVLLTSKKHFVNHEVLLENARKKEPLILSFWHNRLMLIPQITKQTKKLDANYKLMALVSRHGDGQFVGKLARQFGLILVVGSTQRKRKSSRGIEFSSLKHLINGLKKGHSLGITPDGPRGPNQKINGAIINIAKISGAKILPLSCSTSRFKKLRSWDKFTIPLPFSKICFYFDNKLITVEETADKTEIKKLSDQLKRRMDFTQEKSEKFVNHK